MKLAILGKGKTGRYVTELLKDQDQIEYKVFDSKRPATLEDLKSFDVCLSFLTGEVFISYIDILTESGICVVTGSTGFEFNDFQLANIQSGNAAWIKANNFSLGMNIVKQMIEVMSLAPKLFDDYKCSIHEIHHTKKLDAPSGTALSWSDWLDLPNHITSERIGDVVGTHTLTLETQTEKISLTHEALDRSIFAKGAIWAVKKVQTLEPGLHDFSKIALSTLLEEK